MRDNMMTLLVYTAIALLGLQTQLHRAIEKLFPHVQIWITVQELGDIYVAKHTRS